MLDHPIWCLHGIAGCPCLRSCSSWPPPGWYHCRRLRARALSPPRHPHPCHPPASPAVVDEQDDGVGAVAQHGGHLLRSLQWERKGMHQTCWSAGLAITYGSSRKGRATTVVQTEVARQVVQRAVRNTAAALPDAAPAGCRSRPQRGVQQLCRDLRLPICIETCDIELQQPTIWKLPSPMHASTRRPSDAPPTASPSVAPTLQPMLPYCWLHSSARRQ